MSFRLFAVALLLASALLHSHPCRAQEPIACTLGRVSERVAPHYPDTLNGRALQGVVSMLATFAPDGKVSSSKVFAGPSALRFESEAYVRGWRAEPSEEPRQCTITLEYRFDGSQGVCGPHRQVQVRAERQDDTHVLMRLSCGGW